MPPAIGSQQSHVLRKGVDASSFSAAFSMSTAAGKSSFKSTTSSATKKKLCFNEKGMSRIYLTTDPPFYVSLWVLRLSSKLC